MSEKTRRELEADALSEAATVIETLAADYLSDDENDPQHKALAPYLGEIADRLWREATALRERPRRGRKEGRPS